MKAFVIIAHGSRSESANAEFLALAQALSPQLSQYQLHSACFLEIAKPSLDECCAELVAQGVDSIDIYPLFFNRGKHVAIDIPEAIANLTRLHPKVSYNILPYFGSDTSMRTAVISHIHSLTQA